MISELSPPNTYSMHTPFMNFSRFGYRMPIYINMVRDPIERAISTFYYARAPWRINSSKIMLRMKPSKLKRWLKQNFETCVLKKHRKCSHITGETCISQAAFICGLDPKCFKFNTEWAIQKAKQNLERHYSVVGILEEIDLTLKVLEKYLPRFFNGASRIYSANAAKFKNINRNFIKPKVSEKIKNILRQNFTQEIEFYEFCKQRLYKQYFALN